MRFGSVCSGIESASIAWEPLGWKAAWFAEIEAFPSAVLAHRFPDVPNLGDMTRIADLIETGVVEAPDILVGGTPCQSFSVAGLRKGLADARGQLTLSYLELANAIDDARAGDGLPPCVIVWENVLGVLNHKDNPFGCFLAGLAGEEVPLQPAGTKWSNAGVVLGPQRAVAWRVLDAQYIGLAQRRNRVFVVASARQGFDPVELLLEFEGVRRDSPPSRTQGEGLTHPVAPCLTSSGRGVERTGDPRGQDAVVAVRTDRSTGLTEGPHPCAPSDRMRAFGDYVFDETASTTKARDYKDATDLVVYEDPTYGLTTEQTPKFNPDCALTLTKQSPTGGGQPQCVAYRVSGNCGAWETGDRVDALTTGTDPTAQVVVLPFDTTQITSPNNYSNPQNGDPCHPLAAGAHVPAIAFTQNTRSEVRLIDGDGQIAGCLGADTGMNQTTYIAFTSKDYGADATIDLSPTLRAGGHSESHANAGVPPAIAYNFQASQSGVRINDTVGTLDANYGNRRHNGVLSNMAVRRLLPVECERLQGFPDGHTDVPVGPKGKPAADGPRYKSLGNSMATNVMSWIGRRIVREIRTAEYRNLIG